MKPFGARGNFEFSSPSTVSRLAVRGAAVTIFSGGISLLLQVLATVILGRLLRPLDFGIVAIVTTLSLLLMNCGLNGITEAVLQRETIDHTLASTLFWINLAAGIVLTAGFAVSGCILARLYDDPRIAAITAAMSLTILATSASVLHLALLKRAMLFGMISLNDIIARTISVCVSISLGIAGCGYWALVAGAIAMAVVTSIGAWWRCRWLPGLPKLVPGTGAMIWFAVHTYDRFALNYLTRNIDNILAGWLFGGQALGYYKRAYDLFALSAAQLISPLTTVAVTTLSKLTQNTPEYKRYFLRALGVVAIVGMFLSGYLTLIGADLIRLLLGPGWEPAGRIFTNFGPGIGMMLVAGTHGWIHLSLGKPDRWFRWGILEVIVTVLLFILSMRWGCAGLATAWTISFWILGIPSLWYAGRPIRLTAGEITALIWRYCVAALASWYGCVILIKHLPSLLAMGGAVGAVLRIGSLSLMFSGGYFGIIVLLYWGLYPLRQLCELILEMCSKSASIPPMTSLLTHKDQEVKALEVVEHILG